MLWGIGTIEGRAKDLYDLIKDPENAILSVLKDKKDVVIGISGFGSAGYPKLIPDVIAELADKGKIAPKITLLTGASAYQVDQVLGERGLIVRRYPYQFSPTMRRLINSGKVEFHDVHLGEWPQYVRSGFVSSIIGSIDLAIVEAVKVDSGGIVPSMSVGAIDAFVSEASKVIIEVNPDIPEELAGIHDIYMPGIPPNREPIPIRNVNDRIGESRLRIRRDKIAAIVESHGHDRGGDVGEPGPIERRIADNLLSFLQSEMEAGRIPREMLPIESGVGVVQDAVMLAIAEAGISGLKAWTEVAQDSFHRMVAEGEMEYISATSLMLSPSGREFFFDSIGEFREVTVLRPQSVTNDWEVIRRLGVIAMNTAVEVDIYGFVNSTHVMGTDIINGIGGSGDFARASYLSIFITPSTRKGGRISCIVPMVSHVDHVDHDVDVVVTEYGVCDLRGKSPRERALEIIENCAHPDYRDGLLSYFEKAVRETGGHMPTLYDLALSWHKTYREKGDMREAIS